MKIDPWVLDLTGGPQYQGRHSRGEPRTADLLAWLAGGALSRARAREFAETVDMTVMLNPGAAALML
ncbi:MAG: hypothetical protein JWM19_7715 [Actinomycetia bacterium]|nr:hypothetical protein [Actinomycetes bacterium]